MPETTLGELLARNARHVESLEADHFDAVQEGQRPAAVSVCCSDSRVSQGGMWDVETPGWLFTAGNIGNQVWDTRDGEAVVSGDVLYPLLHTDTDVAIVVGHTGCGAVTAALAQVSGEGGSQPPGIEKRLETLRPIVEAGLGDPRVDPDRDIGLVDQLVEFNVDRQVTGLRESDAVPDATTVLGFVYDFQGVYDDVRGRCYLVNHEGDTDPDRLRDAAGERFATHARRLLS